MHKYLRTLGFFITGIFLYYGCAVKDRVKDNVKNTEKVYDDASEYIQEFKETMSGIYSNAFMDNVNISMADIKGSPIGLCWPGMRPKLIHIDKTWWAKSSNAQKEALVWHEMAHCICGLDHHHFVNQYPKEWEFASGDRRKRFETGYYIDGCPVSYMYPSVVDDYCAKKYSEAYKYDIFLQCKAMKAFRESKIY